jgi:steroid Delta-isomerase
LALKVSESVEQKFCKIVEDSLGDAMTIEANRKTVAGYFAASREIENTAAAMASFFAQDAISHDPVGAPPHNGKAEILQFFIGITSLFQEVGLTEEFTHVLEQEAAVRWIAKGVGKNGKAVSFDGIDMMKFNDKGEIIELRGYWNPAPVLAEIQ